MTTRRHLIALGAAVLVGGVAGLAGCAAPQPADYAAQSPKLDLKEYFKGRVRGWGMVQDRSGKVLRRFVVSIDGQWELRDGRWQGTLDEHFEWSDGERQRRVWRLQEEAPGRYRGEAGDVIGGATGTSAGPVLNWAYQLRIPYGNDSIDVRLDDWMILIDEGTLLNRAEMSYFGLRVGELTIAFRRE